MMKRTLVRSDFVNRVHLFVDSEASKFNAFRVEPLDTSTLVTGATFDDAWREAMSVVTHMRAEHDKAPLYHPLVFAPFANITAVEHARESAKLSLRNQMIVGCCHADQPRPGPEADPSSHEDRVRNLSAALDQIEFLSRTKAQALN